MENNKKDEQMKKVIEVVLTKDNMAQYKGKSGKLLIMYNGKVLKELITENVYPLYNTVKSLAKRESGTYSKLPKNFKAVFVEMDITKLYK